METENSSVLSETILIIVAVHTINLEDLRNLNSEPVILPKLAYVKIMP